MGVPDRRERRCDERLQLRARRPRHWNFAGRDLTGAFLRPSRAYRKGARGEHKRDHTCRLHDFVLPLAPSLRDAVRLLSDMRCAQLKSEQALGPIEITELVPSKMTWLKGFYNGRLRMLSRMPSTVRMPIPLALPTPERSSQIRGVIGRMGRLIGAAGS